MEALVSLHDETPAVASDPACLVTDWLPPGLGWPDAGNLGTGGRQVAGGIDGGIPGPVPNPPPISTAGTFGAFPPGSLSAATNWAINAVHDNAQPNDVVASPLARKWTVNFTGSLGIPLVANGRVYIVAKEGQSNVRALDVETGAMVWGPIAITSPIGMACDAANLYLLDSGGTLSALDQSSGRVGWTVKLTAQYSFSSPPTAAAGMVFVNGAGMGGTTFGVDAATGKLVWMADTFDGSGGTVAVADGVVYVAEACAQISAFDAKTGKRKWFVHLESCTGGGGSTPSIYQQHMWIPENGMILDMAGKLTGTFSADLQPSFHAGNAYYVKSDILTAVDITSQVLKWTFNPPKNEDVYNSAVIAGGGGQVFVSTDDGYIREVSEVDGTLISSDKVIDNVFGHASGIAVAHNHLFVSADKNLVAY